MTDLALALELLVPTANYQGSLTPNNEEAYNSITWNDARPKPSYAELLAKDEILVKKALKEYAAMQRWARANSGFTFRGNKFSTNFAAPTALAAAMTQVQINKSFVTQWKLDNGSFITMNAASITALYTAINNFNNALFQAEANLAIAIDNGSVTTQSQIASAINSVPNSA